MPDIEQLAFDRPAYATAVVAPDGANATLVTLTVRNPNGKPTGPCTFDLFLSDSAAGVGVTATTASGAVQCKTAGTLGTDIDAAIAKKYLTVQCLANGTYALSITDAAKTAFKVCASIMGLTTVVATLSAASYG